MSSTTQKKKTKGGKQEAVEQINSSAAADKGKPEEDNQHPFEKELAKKVRNMTKKLNGINDLLSKQKNKEIVLNDEQKEKVAGKDELEEDIKDCSEYLKMFKESQAGELKKEREAEKQHQKDLKKARETAVAHIANMLTLHNLRERGVDQIPDDVNDAVGIFSQTLNSLLAGKGDLQWRQERDSFNQYWTSLVSRSKDKIPDTDMTYEDLADNASSLITSGNFPEKIPGKKQAQPAQEEKKVEAKQDPPKEEPKKPKAPKPIPSDYIQKASTPPKVAEENQEEEQAGEGVDMDFLGGFDAFDDDDDEALPPPKLFSKEEEKANEKKEEADEDAAGGNEEVVGEEHTKGGRGRGRPNRKRGDWGDANNENYHGNITRGDRGDRGNRGRYNKDSRGGRGRGRGGQKQDDEGFEVVEEGHKNRGRGRGRGSRGRGDRGDRGDRGGRGGRGGDRPQTAGTGGEFRGGRGIGNRGGDRGGDAQRARPQTSKKIANQMDGEETKAETIPTEEKKE